MRIYTIVIAACLSFVLPAAHAGLKVFACEPEWAALAAALGVDSADIYSATNALQDPHQVQARPSLIAQARKADLMICSGAELEIGWLPQVQRQAANPKVQASAPGFFEAANMVPRLEIPTSVDRSQGDVHPGGNPHIQTDPNNIQRVAEALSGKLAELDPSSAAHYRSQWNEFDARLRKAIVHWNDMLSPLRGKAVVTHHKYWAYLLNWSGLRELATLEPKPGIPPTVAHLADVQQLIVSQPVIAVLRTPYDTAQPSEWMAEHSKVKTVVLPGTVGGLPGTDDLFGLFDVTVQLLVQAASAP